MAFFSFFRVLAIEKSPKIHFIYTVKILVALFDENSPVKKMLPGTFG
jgi:hypothetical protein